MADLTRRWQIEAAKMLSFTEDEFAKVLEGDIGGV